MSITTYVKNWLDTRLGAIDTQIEAVTASVNTLSTSKQDKLMAGDGISISNNVISVSQSPTSGRHVSISAELASATVP